VASLKAIKLISFGANGIDEYYYADHVPVAGEKAILTPTHEEVGGMIGNATSVYAALGGAAAMIDFLPPSAATDKIIKSLEAVSIDTELLVIDPVYSQSRCLILLHEGERIVYVISPASVTKALQPHQLASLNPTTTFYSNVIDFARLANYQAVIDSQTKIVFDVEETAIRPLPNPIQLLQYADILFINEQADDYLCEIDPDYKEALQTPILVITKGARGSQIITPESSIDVEVCPTTLVDTTGAGDTYNAAFLYQFHQGQSLEVCGRFASAAAARAISILGPRSGSASVEQVLAYAKSVNYSI